MNSVSNVQVLSAKECYHMLSVIWMLLHDLCNFVPDDNLDNHSRWVQLSKIPQTVTDPRLHSILFSAFMCWLNSYSPPFAAYVIPVTTGATAELILLSSKMPSILLNTYSIPVAGNQSWPWTIAASSLPKHLVRESPTCTCYQIPLHGPDSHHHTSRLGYCMNGKHMTHPQPAEIKQLPPF